MNDAMSLGGLAGVEAANAGGAPRALSSKWMVRHADHRLGMLKACTASKALATYATTYCVAAVASLMSADACTAFPCEAARKAAKAHQNVSLRQAVSLQTNNR